MTRTPGPAPSAGNAALPVQTIQAAVLRERGGPLKIESLELEGPGDDEVLVRVVAAGICRTDIHFCEDGAGAGPVVLGHEAVGVVERSGKDVKSVAPGDRAILSYASCGRCPQCRHSRPWACRSFSEANFGFQRLDGSNALRRSGVRGHFFGQSSWATHCVVTERNIVRIPRGLPVSVMAPLGCGIQTGAGTVMNSLAVKKGASIAVFGTGTVGMAAVMAARIVGAGPVIGVDLNPGRLIVALTVGATHVINNQRDDVASRIAEVTGKGVDYVVETTGDPVLLQKAIDVLNPRGTAAFLTGASAPGSLSQGRKAISVIQGGAVPQVFIPKLIDLYREGRFPFDRLLRFYDFAEINQAIADVNRGDAIKAVLRIGRT